ncbi:MAG TPA: beta-ketoacyl synthase N-terminal-like domain-containing protein [Pyrinomonadaceae bacterium]|nr:beta-ketoacyl synthase N-terminal-like domain-containing protein [Pyrinomonadaceae bacterium]
MDTELDPLAQCSTFVELLRRRSLLHPAKIALTFLQDGETEKANLTYEELDRHARAIGATLQKLQARGERALLIYPPGLDFIAALFGCFYAGVIAVPAYPPHLNRPMPPRLKAIIDNAEVTLVLTTAPLLSNIEKRWTDASSLTGLRWIATETLDIESADEWRDPEVEADTVAFLQYTSGSTSSPKGVMVSHGNLLHNELMLKVAFEQSEETVFVVWLPLHHDMGLIGNVLQAIYLGGRAILMAPAAFLQSPFRWLQAISRYRARTSGAPNFAYDLCVDKISDEQRSTLDLTSWSLAFNGAEPINHRTLDRFSSRFKPCGFRREVFYPCYGLAEATLFVSGGQKSAAPIVHTFNAEALARNELVETAPEDTGTRTLVSCGHTWLAQEIAIVDPESQVRLGDTQIGEIWLAGPHIAKGYWEQPEASERAFGGYIAETGEGPFLRTGDLGFLKNGELYINGRLKDLIIIRGRNYYPQDIEWTVEQANNGVRAGCVAAFSVDVDGRERLIVAAEVDRHFRSASVEEAVVQIRERIAEEHELEVFAVSLLKFGKIPRTTSGKIQRHACRNDYIAGKLDIVGQWQQPARDLSARNDQLALRPPGDPTANSEIIRTWIVAQIAERVGLDPVELDVRKPLRSYGLDSVANVAITADLGTWLGRDLSPTLIYEHPTIEALVQHLAGETVPSISTSTVAKQETAREPVAIIGIGCRLPGANNADAFWQLLREGIDAITEVPADRWDARAFYSADPVPPPGKMNTRWGGFLDQVDQFDAAFFGIAPREATHMDPQQRLLLEVAWEALEDAGQVPQRLAGTQAGVFIGVATSEYSSMQLNQPGRIDAYASTGGAMSIVANRLSYFFDFRGPSMAVDTACSSSLVAIHLACQSLWRGESTLALAGGANLILSPAVTVSFSQASATSRDGRCKAFDAGANGIVRGEGVGVVVLKPLSRAVADGDEIYAVIKGSAVTQDGKSNGITAPSMAAQEAVLSAALHDAGISPAKVQYVEAHGTGTLLGDPIEAKALGNVLAADRTSEQACVIGSVKSNIGHLEAAAGMASLIKVALAIKHKAIPPSLHLNEPNPLIPFDTLRLRVQQTLGPWPDMDGPAIAGVSAFGFGGTNAHIVLEEAPAKSVTAPVETDEEPVRPYLLPISAQSPEALRSLALAYQQFLNSAESDSISLKSICQMAAVRRQHHDQRLAVVARSRQEMAERLESSINGRSREQNLSPLSAGRHRKVVFVCSGYGGQWWGMGRELLKQEPVFRAAVVQCDELLREYVDWSLVEELRADEDVSRVTGSNVEITQIALFGLQIGLAALWRSWGIEPDAVVGHSLGEVAAAHLSGALTLRDAVRVIFHRSHIMQQKLEQEVPGAMAAVELAVEDAEQLLAGYEDRVSVAVHNAPKSVVLAGEVLALEQVLEPLRQQGVTVRVLSAPGGGHSPQAEGARNELEQALTGLQPAPPNIPIFSTVTGSSGEQPAFDAAYWGRNVRQRVRFSEAIARLGQEGYDMFLELSPQPILSAAITQCLSHHKYSGTVLPTLRRKRDDRTTMLASLGQLYTGSYPVDWTRIYPQSSQHVKLPAYPWQRQRYWIENQKPESGREWRRSATRSNGAPAHPLLERHLASSINSGTHFWEMDLGIGMSSGLGGHRVKGRVLLPATAYMDMALAAATEVFGDAPHALENMSFSEPLALSKDEAGSQKMQLVVSDAVSGAASFQFFSLDARTTQGQASWTLRARGKIRVSRSQ